MRATLGWVTKSHLPWRNALSLGGFVQPVAVQVDVQPCALKPEAEPASKRALISPTPLQQVDGFCLKTMVTLFAWQEFSLAITPARVFD